MNCKNCGMPLNSDQKFCPSCGSKVDNGTTTSNVVDSQSNISPNVNINVSSDIGFNRNMEQDLAQFGSNNPYDNRNTSDEQIGVSSVNTLTSQVNNVPDQNGNSTVNKKKKSFPWIGLAIFLVIFMFGGVFLLPIIKDHQLKTYEATDYRLKYNANWSVDSEKEKMTLYYSDKDSRFAFSTSSTFASLRFQVVNDNDKQVLYKTFYNSWAKLKGGKLTGGTNTFLPLNDDTLYARVDYQLDNASKVGAFYVLVSEKHDKVVTFVLYCNLENWDKVNSDVMEMLESVTFRSLAEKEDYKKFKANNIKEYSSVGYMDYDVPDCWVLDEARTKALGYKSNIFEFRDGVSLLDIKALTSYDSTTMVTGTTYEKIKATVVKKYGSIKEESQKTINGVTWYLLITPKYVSGDYSYHNEIYFTLSSSKNHIYYLEAYVYNDTTDDKTKYLNDSIEYILSSAILHKLDD